MSRRTTILIALYAGLLWVAAVATIREVAARQPASAGPADVNGDGKVSFADVTAVLTAMGGNAPPAAEDPTLAQDLSAALVVAFNFDGGHGPLVYAAFRLPDGAGAEGFCNRLNRRDAFKGPTVDGSFPAFNQEPAR